MASDRSRSHHEYGSFEVLIFVFVLYCIVETSWPSSPPELILLVFSGGDEGVRTPGDSHTPYLRAVTFEVK